MTLESEKMNVNLEEIFTIKNIIIYLIIINIITFLAMFIDKRRAKRGEWRIKEGTLLGLAILGGSIGGIAGMYVFRHKTKKLRFTIWFSAILITDIALVIYFKFFK